MMGILLYNEIPQSSDLKQNKNKSSTGNSNTDQLYQTFQTNFSNFSPMEVITSHEMAMKQNKLTVVTSVQVNPKTRST